ncbi:hypothetical protein [Nesterenkonia flava]|uniref:Uncharacterized protein n=1 Tax=Nesterenkonia flava TaxID=469799 RepID=A0ABU1FTZ5_9MICC|nr:hypothetical protein [Nesterenkonia flava]MDR5712131.1 hypothetical protein [Nesterenkonia flava]
MSTAPESGGRPGHRGQMDPWTTGTPAYRVTLVGGMGLTFAGILAVLAAAFVGAEAASTLRTVGLYLIVAGLLTHVVSIGLRKRQAAQIIRARRDSASNDTDER